MLTQFEINSNRISRSLNQDPRGLREGYAVCVRIDEKGWEEMGGRDGEGERGRKRKKDGVQREGERV